MKYLWDTNTAIHYLQNQFPHSAGKFMDSILQNSQAAFSVITEIELLCWKAATSDDMELLKNFIDDSIVFELQQPIKLKTAEIRNWTYALLTQSIRGTPDFCHKDTKTLNFLLVFCLIPNMHFLVSLGLGGKLTVLRNSRFVRHIK